VTESAVIIQEIFAQKNRRAALAKKQLFHQSSEIGIIGHLAGLSSLYSSCSLLYSFCSMRSGCFQESPAIGHRSRKLGESVPIRSTTIS
jgi:hypothetical protein